MESIKQIHTELLNALRIINEQNSELESILIGLKPGSVDQYKADQIYDCLKLLKRAVSALDEGALYIEEL